MLVDFFPILFDEWRLAADSAEDAWQDIRCKLGTAGADPSAAALCQAVRLRWAELEWQEAIYKHLRNMRGHVAIL